MRETHTKGRALCVELVGERERRETLFGLKTIRFLKIENIIFMLFKNYYLCF